MSKIGRLRDLLVSLLREHERDGALPTSARFLFYEMVTREHISKAATGARRADQDLIDALTDIRETAASRGIGSSMRLVRSTATRATPLSNKECFASCPASSSTPGADTYRVITESRSLAGVLRRAVSDYACQIASTNG
jgi:hypothetical protein